MSSNHSICFSIFFQETTCIYWWFMRNTHFSNGAVAEWLRSGLQIRVYRFDSGPRLHYYKNSGQRRDQYGNGCRNFWCPKIISLAIFKTRTYCKHNCMARCLFNDVAVARELRISNWWHCNYRGMSHCRVMHNVNRMGHRAGNSYSVARQNPIKALSYE